MRKDSIQLMSEHEKWFWANNLEELKRLQGIVPLEDDDYNCSRDYPSLLSIAVGNYNLEMTDYLLLNGCKDPLALESTFTCSTESCQRLSMFKHLWAS